VVKSSVENVYADSQKVTRELIDRYFELSLRPGNRRAFVDRFAAKTDPNAIQKIPSINRPTLILWGEQDMLIPVENAFRFHRELPNDTLVILKNSGHVPMEENPRESLLAVQAFLQSK
jgi:pimeloyl-ACP methyl ester carboxylesterase